jgi:hypothetical protein
MIRAGFLTRDVRRADNSKTGCLEERAGVRKVRKYTTNI